MLERDIICSGLYDLATLRLEAGDNRALPAPVIFVIFIGMSADQIQYVNGFKHFI